MTDLPRIVVLGASSPSDLPLSDLLKNRASLSFATEGEALKRALPGAAILLGWDFRAGQLQQAWDAAGDLRWIHWCGAGVDAALFPALRDGDVVLTNARGLFDQAMAEYVLGLIIAMARSFPATFAAKTKREWSYRMTGTALDKQALIVGVGSIGRAVARLLRAAGMQVSGVGRTPRSNDGDFVRIYGTGELDQALAGTDVVVNVTPLTEQTRNLFSTARFDAMKPSAHFINIGRGASVDEDALIEALRSGAIKAAALDVFLTEPLPADSPLWEVENLIISPHMSGDTHDYQEVIMKQFLDNLDRYVSGRPLENIVDKSVGFVTS
jgi:phosphoglycerate dehydrogenase-like enzyme